MSTTALQLFWDHVKSVSLSYWKYGACFVAGSLITGYVVYVHKDNYNPRSPLSFIHLGIAFTYETIYAFTQASRVVHPQITTIRRKNISFVSSSNKMNQQQNTHTVAKTDTLNNMNEPFPSKALRDNPTIQWLLCPSSKYEEKHIPLNKWTVSDISGRILTFILNDLDYQSHLSRTQAVFARHKLNGEKLMYLSSDDVKCIIKDDMLQFITPHTLHIMCAAIYHDEHLHIPYTCEQIACMLYNYPIHQLLRAIEQHKLDGKGMIDILTMQTACGWKADEMEQIRLLLENEMICTEYEFKRKVSSHDDAAVQRILNNIMDVIDIEQVQYNIKHNRDTEEFSDIVRHMIDEWMTNYGHNKCERICELYSNIAQCFVYHEEHLKYWVCCNCGNHNFSEHSYANNPSLSYCTACGISQLECVIRKIRNENTSASLFVRHESNEEEKEVTAEQDYIIQLIEEVVQAREIDLVCRGRTDGERCPSILRLAKCLIQHREWIDTIYSETKGKDSVEQTTKIDIECIDDQKFKDIITSCVYSDGISTIVSTAFDLHLVNKMFTDRALNIETFTAMNKRAFVQQLYTDANVPRKWGGEFYKTLNKQVNGNTTEDERFKIVFMKCAKSMHETVTSSYDIDVLVRIFHQKIVNARGFKNMNKQSFTHMMKTEGNINTSFSGTLYTKIRKALTSAAEQQQWTAFLASLDMDLVDRDYRHILDIHVQKGDGTSVRNVFEFFNHVAHWDASEKDIKECRSFKRRSDRMRGMKEENTYSEMHEHKAMDCEDTASLRQYYIQSELDVIHSYLVHSEWKAMVKHFTNQNHIEFTEYKEEPHDGNTNNKYVTTEYGFGVVHEHHRLRPKWHSIYDELTHNKKCNLGDNVWHQLLVKTIHKHQVAMGDKGRFVSKYLSKPYHILRNEAIGIRHILALIVYTDMTRICTEFRRTYRRTGTQSETDVTEQHTHFYHLAKSLLEAVEYFGQQMKPELKVFHGLNKRMSFDKFTAFFNQPISTTLSFESARGFAHENGVILTLRSGLDDNELPKYLSVAWLSSYPHEDEKLFYGGHQSFKIDNMYYVEGTKWKSLSKELCAFNQFQKLITNQQPNWSQTDINIIIPYITHQIENDSKSQQYDHLVFNHFCDHTTRICINDFHSLRPSLRNILFSSQSQEPSITPLLKLFGNLKEIVLNHIDMNVMSNNCSSYLKMIQECIAMPQYRQYLLKRISFQSNPRHNHKQNPTLNRFAADALSKLAKDRWSVEYQFEIETHHNLIFMNDVIQIKDKMLELQLQKQQILEEGRAAGLELKDMHMHHVKSIENIEMKRQPTICNGSCKIHCGSSIQMLAIQDDEDVTDTEAASPLTLNKESSFLMLNTLTRTESTLVPLVDAPDIDASYSYPSDDKQRNIGKVPPWKPLQKKKSAHGRRRSLQALESGKLVTHIVTKIETTGKSGSW
eukprot:609787_1